MEEKRLLKRPRIRTCCCHSHRPLTPRQGPPSPLPPSRQHTDLSLFIFPDPVWRRRANTCLYDVPKSLISTPAMLYIHRN